MLNIVLYQPEIPPNTGNVIRLCANIGARLHLVGPLGFHLDEASVRRAGMDYRELADVRQYPDWKSYVELNDETRTWAFSTRGTRFHAAASFRRGDALLFGPESRGLPREVLDEIGQQRILRLPMRDGSRSVNLSNAVAAGAYEALRQLDFEGLR
ncbi:MAG: tRNA (cytidine(34)-2'-O)-methyltransferase [Xanthomonadales bacterium]|nr:tRNA (cytidine(34)-2'-O)-methyltransferase [Gammaproteobacteria bacterium]MBT8063559.1 tRNA (cytidine(34)-2'-O)-methyltransferase [Gammaproteobacteria bacterium]NNJ64293.1 tRNA (cytidine(34)-2'-O)-methyltransferase [Xanthomonadales bacterium]